MTKKIADALSDTFKYYIENSEENYEDICAKSIIFIYTVSSVDFTYLHYAAKLDGEMIRNTLTGLIDKIFHAFVGKVSIKTSKLENLVYTKAFCEYWNIKYNIKKLLLVDYCNFINNSCIYDIGKIQIDEVWEEIDERIEDMFNRYGNYLSFQKATTLEDFESQIMKRGKEAEYNIESSVKYILDLINADSIEVFNENHEVVYNQITGLPIKGATWKAGYLQAKFLKK